MKKPHSYKPSPKPIDENNSFINVALAEPFTSAN
jgi:hypothetical protein